jgi:hypothetical protein
MLKEQKNSKLKGTVGVGAAIAYFTKYGYSVSLPLNDSQKYDIIVDINDKLNRVSVKTTNSRASTKNLTFKVFLRTTGGNQSFHTAKDFDHTKCELLFVLSESGTMWNIPTSEFDNTNCIQLGTAYNKFIVE